MYINKRKEVKFDFKLPKKATMASVKVFKSIDDNIKSYL